MCSLLATALIAGKEIVGMLTDNENKTRQPVNRMEQLANFDDRLDHALQPEKARFNQFLENKQIGSLEELQALADQLKQTILSDADLSGFLSANGGYDASFTIEKLGDNFVLHGASGSHTVPFNSNMRSWVAQLYEVQSVLGTSQEQPGLSLSQAIDLAFAETSQSVPQTQVTVN